MIINRILKVVLLLLGGCYVVLQGFALQMEAVALSTFMLFLLIILYNKSTEEKDKHFFLFLATFTMAHFINLFAYYGPEIGANAMDYYYYSSNILYIISYIFLIIRILRDLDFKVMLLQFSIPIFILVILDIFCVSIITATTEAKLTFYEYTLEYTYNAVIMALLSAALINYMYRNDNKSMLLLIGSIFIVFSEIIQLTYYYIMDSNDLGFVFSLFLVVAFLFFFLQSQIKFTGPVPEYTDEQLET